MRLEAYAQTASRVEARKLLRSDCLDASGLGERNATLAAFCSAKLLGRQSLKFSVPSQQLSKELEMQVFDDISQRQNCTRGIALAARLLSEPAFPRY